MKLLIENWREYLNEAKAPTVGEYLKYIEDVLKKSGQEKFTKGMLTFGIGADEAGGFIQNLENIPDALGAILQDANEDDISSTDFAKNPFLIYLDIWDPYEKVLRPEIIKAFLLQIGQQLKKEGYSLSSPMPDIDQLLELYVLERFEMEIDGAPHADDEWKDRDHFKELPGAGGIAKRAAKSAISDIKGVGQKVAQTTRRLRDRFQTTSTGQAAGRFADAVTEDWRKYLTEQADNEDVREKIVLLFADNMAHGIHMAEMTGEEDLVERFKKTVESLKIFLLALKKGDVHAQTNELQFFWDDMKQAFGEYHVPYNTITRWYDLTHDAYDAMWLHDDEELGALTGELKAWAGLE